MAIYSKLIEGLTNGEEHFIKVFAVNHKGRVNNRIDLPWASCIPSAFPAEPSAYELINTYTSATTFTAPEEGYYQIVLQGASGNGGAAYQGPAISHGSGAGGGGGGCAISRVKLNKGDTIIFTSIAVGSTATVYINSSIEIYPNMLVSSGSNGGNCGSSPSVNASAGNGGSASGGNYANYAGNKGSNGKWSTLGNIISGGSGGDPGYSDGNVGGNGAGLDQSLNGIAAGSGKTAFMQVYRGNTNVA